MVLSLLMAFGSCNEKQAPQTAEELILPVKVFRVGSDLSARGRNFPARTQPAREVALSFRVAGPLKILNAVEGRKVEKGELVAMLDDRDFRVDLESKKADYELAKVEMERYERLFKKQSIAENEYDQKVAAFKTTEARYADAQNALKDVSLYAPFTGYFGEVPVENHEEVQAKQTIATLLDLSNIEIQLYVPESMLFDRDDVEGFEVFFENYTEKVFHARLKEVGKVADAEGFPVTLTLDTDVLKNLEGANLARAAGFTVRVNILFKETAASRKVLVPVTSVMEPEGRKGSIVWVFDPVSKTVRSREVELGVFGSKSTIEVTRGLENGEWIVTAGIHRLKDGQKVKELPAKL